MKNLQDKQKKVSEELSPLTPYHWERCKKAEEEQERMNKNPLTIEQVRAQIAADRIVNARRK